MDAQEERKEEYGKGKEVKGKAEKKEAFAPDLQRTVHERQPPVSSSPANCQASSFFLLRPS